MKKMKKNDPRQIAKKFKKKLSQIKVFLVDVDGILTDGHIFYSGNEVGFNRSFHALDGYGLKLIREHGIKIGFITGGDSISVKKRAEYLGLDFLFLGTEDKRKAFLEVEAKGYKPEEILYMGDELFDIPLLTRSGFSATVPNAPVELHENVDYVTVRDGGEGAVREVIDLVRYAQNIHPKILDFE